MMNTKDQLLTISLKFFLQKGYTEVSMSDLVTASGLSKGAFYHYFPSKEKLYEETLNKYFFSFLEDFNMEYDDSKSFLENIGILYQGISLMMDEIHTIIGSDIHIISYYRTIWESMSRIPHMRSMVKRYYSEYMESLTHWIEKAQKKGEIRQDLDNEILSFQLASLIEGTLVIHSFEDADFDLLEVFDRIYGQVYDLIKIK